MPAAPLPPEEAERLVALERYAILDTLPEQQYDDLTFLAAQICGTPISLVSLVAQDRQWFKARYGLEAQQTPRNISFCAYAIHDSKVLEVNDARTDARFADNSLVNEQPNIRFYAGAPLVTPEGHKLGTLCVLDSKPRQLTSNQHRALEALARQAMTQMDLWRVLKRSEMAEYSRREALQRLEANAEILRQFVEHAPAAIAMFDDKLCFLAVSKRFRDQHHLDREELLGKEIEQTSLVLPEREAQALRQVLEDGHSVTCDCEEILSPDGNIKFFHWEVRPWLSSTGEVGGVLLLAEDITEQERARRLKNELVAVVSHELRTPLTSIRGALGLVTAGVAGELPSQARDLVSIAHKNAERLVALVNDILDTEKIEAGQMNFDFQQLPVEALLRTAQQANASYGQELGVTIEVEAPKAAALCVRGDEVRLMQVLTNLISNAIKFSPAGGVVNIHAYAAPRGRVRFEVIDEGQGVPEEFVPRLFEKFAQAEDSARRTKGTGLGLSISQSIIAHHEGCIGYLPPDSSVGRSGATFFFEVPACEDY